ncbi:hypothetical protein O0544_06415 [Edwardsiella anguillarum]|nr:hypothetical protein [Edwardsiella anguillarum]
MTVDINDSDLTDVAAVVLSVQDALGGALEKVEQSAFGLPVFVAEACDQRLPAEYLPRLTGVFACGDGNQDFYGKQLESAAQKYEAELLPPFSAACRPMSSRATLPLTARGIRAGSSSAAIPPAAGSSTTSARPCSAPICATPTSPWATC